MKQRLLILVSVWTATLSYANDQTNNAPSSPPVFILNDNSHTVKQITPQKPDLTVCDQFPGKELTSCMLCQTPQNFRKNLQQFGPLKAHQFLLDLSLREYWHMTKQYSPEQWQEFYEQIDPEYRPLFPKTITEQIQGLKKIIKDARAREEFSPFMLIGTFVKSILLPELILFDLTQATTIGKQYKEMDQINKYYLQKDFEQFKHQMLQKGKQ